MKTGLFVVGCVLGLALAHAKSPPTDTSKQAATPADTIDVDAMARAKDTTDTPAEPTTAAATPANTTDAAPAQTAPPQSAPPDEATPPNAAATSTDAGAGATSNPPAAPENAAATPATPTPSSQFNTTAPVPDAAEKRLIEGCESRATTLLDAAEKGDYATATHDFNAKMRSALPPEKFKQAWASLAQFGKLVARGQSQSGGA